MANLTGQNIKDTYQELVTLGTGNAITDGTGSAITALDVTASYATSASYAPVDSAFSASIAGRQAADEVQIALNTSAIGTLTAATASYITASQTGSMTVLSSSYAVTASYALNGGGGATQNIQQVLDTGNVTTTSMRMTGSAQLQLKGTANILAQANSGLTYASIVPDGSTKVTIAGAGPSPGAIYVGNPGASADAVYLNDLKWPTADGTGGYYLQTDGAGTLTWQSSSAGATPTIQQVLDAGNVSTTLLRITGSAQYQRKGLNGNNTDVWQANSGLTYAAISTDGSSNVTIAGAGPSPANIKIGNAGSGATGVYLNDLAWPTADGASGEFLKTDGAGTLTWATASVATPDLAAVLAAGNTTLTTSVRISGSAQLQVKGPSSAIPFQANSGLTYASIVPDGSSKITIAGAGPIPGDIYIGNPGASATGVYLNDLAFPTADGSAGQVIKTDGAGALSFTDTVVSASNALTASNADKFFLNPENGTAAGSYPVYFTNEVVSGSGKYASTFVRDNAQSFYYSPNTDTLTVSNLAGSSSYASNANQLDGLDSTAFAVLANNNVFSGNQTFTDIAVNGTASIAYLQAVTGSAKIIGDAYIILNTNVPAERYAGIKVVDSGSAAYTASLQFDGQTNDWFYQYEDGTVDHAVALFGPAYPTKGSPTYLTTGAIPRSSGSHHLVDSNISDSGTAVSITVPTTVTAAVRVTGSSGQFQVKGTNNSMVFQANSGLTYGSLVGDGGTNITIAGAGPSPANIKIGNPGASADGVYLNDLKWPTADGTAGYYLQTDGAGTLTWESASGGGTPTIQQVLDTGNVSTTLLRITGSAQFQRKGLNGNNTDVWQANSGLTYAAISTDGTANVTIAGSGPSPGNIKIGNAGSGATGVYLNDLAWPTADGSANYYLQTDGAGTLSWQSGSAPTPNISAVLAAGNTTLTTSLRISGSAQLQFKGTGTSIPFQAQSGLTYASIVPDGSDVTIAGAGPIPGNIKIGNTGTGATGVYLNDLVWPTSDGSAGQYLKTDGAGNLSFAAVAIPAASASTESGNLLFENINGEIYGSAASPVTGNLTIDGSSVKIPGATAIVYHSGSSEPTVSGGTINKKVGNYSTTSLNVITFTNIDGTNFLEYIAGGTTTLTASYVEPLNQSVQITGSLNGNVESVLIGSNTGSLDLSSANFFDITLVSGSNTHIVATNIQPGQTVNFKLQQPGTGWGTVTFGAEFEFVNGSAFTVTTGSNATDVVTFISFDGSTLQATGLSNFI